MPYISNKLSLRLKYLPAIILVLLLSPLLLSGQAILNGRTLSNDSSTMSGVSIYNRHSKQAATSDDNGGFTLPNTRSGDTILFSGVSVIARYWIVPPNPGTSVHTIMLRPRIIGLATISIRSHTYQQDSIANRQEYAAAFNFHRPRFKEIVHIAPVGIGVNINQLTRAAAMKRNRHKIFFRDQLIRYEQEGFVNVHYNEDIVSSTIPLRGDSLTYFVNRYRPTYEQVHDGSEYDVLFFIHQAYKRYCDSLLLVKDTIR